MFSPALRHRQAKLARIAIEKGASAGIAPARASTGIEATEYELLLASLGEDMARLKDIQGKELKIAAKREMIEAYTHHVDATLAAAAQTGKAVQDELLATMMIWLIDIGDFTRGLDIAEHVLRFGLGLPARYLRPPATLVAEEIAEAALAADAQGKDFDIAVLQRVADLTEKHDMADQARAKLHKALGKQFLRTATAADEKPETAAAGAAKAARAAALDHFRRAIGLNKSIGVKKDIERLTSWLEKHAPAQDPENENDEQKTE